MSHNCGLSADSIQRVVQPTVNEDGQKAPGFRFGDPRVMALPLALTLFQHLVDGFHNRDLRQHVAGLLGSGLEGYSVSQMTYDLRRLRRKGLIYRRVGTRRYFATPYGWKVARVFRPAMVVFGEDRNGLPPTLSAALERVDHQLDALIDNAVPDRKAA